MKKTKVLVDVYQLGIAKTGIRKYVEELVDLLDKKDNNQLEVIFYPPIEQINTFTKNPSRFSRLKEQWQFFYHKQFSIPLIANKLGVDVVLMPDYYAPLRRLKAHKLVVFHDTFFWDNPEQYGRLWWYYFKKMIMLGLNGKSSVLTISNFSKQKLESVLPNHVSIDTLPHASRKRMKTDSDICKRLALQEKAYFLHVGVFELRKNLLFLVEAFAQLKENEGFQSLKLVMVGEAPAGKTANALSGVKERIKTLGLTEDVLLPGYLTDKEIASLYSNALAYVFPSKNEGFGYPVLEAFAYGCPVLVSDQPALVEVGGDAVMVFPKEDMLALEACMRKISNDGALREALIDKGRERLKAFDRESYVDRLKAILDQYT